MGYTQHMTDEYDAQFAKVKDLKWYPWVGKNYHKTGIFVVGMSTDKRHDKRPGKDWTQDLDDPREASRVLASWYHGDEVELFQFNANGQLFKKTAHIFTDYAGLERGTNTYAIFWQAVAFNNLFQVVVPDIGAIPEQPDIEKAKRAFYETINIIKPKLILAWETDRTDCWNWSCFSHQSKILH